MKLLRTGWRVATRLAPRRTTRKSIILCVDVYSDLTSRCPQIHVSSIRFKPISPLSTLTEATDYDYLVPLYHVNNVLASNGLRSLDALEAQVSLLSISEQVTSVPSSQKYPPPSPRDECQHLTNTDMDKIDHGVVGYQPADIYSLEDTAGAAPNDWSILPGTDSGLWSWEVDGQLEPCSQPTMGYIANTSDNDNHCPATASHPPIDSTLTSEHIISSFGSKFDDQNIPGTATKPIPLPVELDEEALISHDPVMNHMSPMDHVGRV